MPRTTKFGELGPGESHESPVRSLPYHTLYTFGDLAFFVASCWLGCLSFTLAHSSAIPTNFHESIRSIFLDNPRINEPLPIISKVSGNLGMA